MEFVAKEAEKEGLKVTIVPFSDYVTPNQALAQGDIDVNSYQHVPFLEAFNEKTAQNLFPSETLTSRPFVCSQINTRLCPISPTAHPLQFRTIHPTAAAPSFSWRKRPAEIKRRRQSCQSGRLRYRFQPENLKIIELEAPQLPRALEDCDASIINGGYAVSAGLDPKTALAQEDNTSPYVNVIAAREQDKDNPTYQKFVKIFQTEATRKYINDNFQATLTPGF